MSRRFILVHSPSVGPGTWASVADWLQSEGHETRVPDLLGIGRHGPPYWPALVDQVAEAIVNGPGVLAVSFEGADAGGVHSRGRRTNSHHF
jgi:hypothetical protein